MQWELILTGQTWWGTHGEESRVCEEEICCWGTGEQWLWKYMCARVPFYELSTVVEDPLEKEIRGVIVVLVWETNTVAGVVDKSKVGKPRGVYIILRLKRSVLEKDETWAGEAIIVDIFIDMLKLSIWLVIFYPYVSGLGLWFNNPTSLFPNLA